MQLSRHNPITQSVPDAMHTTKDVIVHIFNLITGREDSYKVHDVECEVNRFGVPSSKRESGTHQFFIIDFQQMT